MLRRALLLIAALCALAPANTTQHRRWATALVSRDEPAQPLRQRCSPRAILMAAESGDLVAIGRDILAVAGHRDVAIAINSSADVETAAAVEGGESELLILYNPRFLATLVREADTGWATVFIIAHEMAHHLLGHTTGSIPVDRGDAMELEADEIVGLVLGTCGASLEDVEHVVNVSGRVADLAPQRIALMLTAVQRGWHKRLRPPNIAMEATADLPSLE